jgi:hypothetical protein
MSHCVPWRILLLFGDSSGMLSLIVFKSLQLYTSPFPQGIRFVVKYTVSSVFWFLVVLGIELRALVAGLEPGL